MSLRVCNFSMLLFRVILFATTFYRPSSESDTSTSNESHSQHRNNGELICQDVSHDTANTNENPNPNDPANTNENPNTNDANSLLDVRDSLISSSRGKSIELQGVNANDPASTNENPNPNDPANTNENPNPNDANSLLDVRDSLISSGRGKSIELQGMNTISKFEIGQSSRITRYSSLLDIPEIPGNYSIISIQPENTQVDITKIRPRGNHTKQESEHSAKNNILLRSEDMDLEIGPKDPRERESASNNIFRRGANRILNRNIHPNNRKANERMTSKASEAIQARKRNMRGCFRTVWRTFQDADELKQIFYLAIFEASVIVILKVIIMLMIVAFYCWSCWGDVGCEREFMPGSRR